MGLDERLKKIESAALRGGKTTFGRARRRGQHDRPDTR